MVATSNDPPLLNWEKVTAVVSEILVVLIEWVASPPPRSGCRRTKRTDTFPSTCLPQFNRWVAS